jgi:hypothetical protein
MRIGAAALAPLAFALLLAFTGSSCGGASGGGWFRQYEYDEEIDLSSDGMAIVSVSSSLPALNALRGTSFDTRPNVPVDREAIRAYFTSPVTRVTDIGTFRRANRRFVRVRIEVDDVRRLGEAAPFAWSRYSLTRSGDEYVFRQSLGPAAGGEVGDAGWTGTEMVAFRLHLPSRVTYHNTVEGPLRGNILRWEQPLAERLRGGAAPTLLEARMDTESILYRTLWLFGWTMAAVVATFAFAIWWMVRRSVKTAEV